MLRRYIQLAGHLLALMTGILALAGCGTQPTVLPTQAAVAVVGTADAVGTAVPANAPIPTSQPTATLPELPTAEAGERPLLPRFAGSAAFTNQAAGLNAASLPAPGAFTAVAFSLNAELPTGPATAAALRASALPFTFEEAQRLAARFGFSGPLYTQMLPDVLQTAANLPAGAAAPPDLTPAFYAFDGPRTLTINPTAVSYTDSRVPVDFRNPLPFQQAAPAAEAFLQARGLLDFPYTLEEGWGHEVFVVRLIDGRPASQPDISVGVGGDGQVAYVNYQTMAAPDIIGEYPLIPAETAWQQLQAGPDENVVISAAAPGATPPAEPVSGFQYWPREHRPGPDVHLYAWPTAFAPADGNGAPRVQILNYTLQADADVLGALAAQVGQNVHVWGSLEAGTGALTVAGWEPLPELNPLFKSGVVQRVEGQARLQDAASGETFILPDVPADVPDGATVNVFAWAVRQTGLAFPVLDWEGIDRQLTEGAPAAVESGEDTAVPAYTELTIEAVTLAYYTQAIGSQIPETLWQPAWKFRATAANGDILTFYLQAIDPAFRQTE